LFISSFRPTRRVRDRFGVAVTILMVVLQFSGALAQQPMAELRSAHVATLSPRAARVDFVFAGVTPQYKVVGASTPQVTMTFASARLRGVLAIDTSSSGITAVVEDRHGDATVTFRSDTPIRVQVEVSPPKIAVVLVRDSASTGSVATTPDTMRSGGPVHSVAIKLQYADVTEVAGLLGQASVQEFGVSAPSYPVQSSTFGQIGVGASPPLLQSSPAFTNTGPVATRISEGVSIDRRLNAIILTLDDASIQRYKEMLAVVDQPVPSVLIEASIVELTATAAKAVGIDFSSSGQIGTVTLSEKSGSLADATVNLQAAIYAQAQRGNGKIVARPKVFASNTVPASIVTGDAIPIVTAIAFAGTGTLVQQQVQYVNVGVTLNILPRISENGLVFTRLSAEVSSLTDYVQGFPRISQRRADTSAVVRDGESLIVGGLLQDSDLSAVSKIPGLGDLPVIGGLFRLRRDTKQRADLYIVITPHIVYPSRQTP
jgi:general secretion pathway protein D